MTTIHLSYPLKSQGGVTIRTIQTSTLLYKTLAYIFKSYTLESHVVHTDPKQKNKISRTNINLLVLINVLIMLIKIGIYRGVALDQTDVQK